LLGGGGLRKRTFNKTVPAEYSNRKKKDLVRTDLSLCMRSLAILPAPYRTTWFVDIPVDSRTPAQTDGLTVAEVNLKTVFLIVWKGL